MKRMTAVGVRRGKAVLFQWVREPTRLNRLGRKQSERYGSNDITEASYGKKSQ